MRLVATVEGETRSIEVLEEREGTYRVRLGDEWLDVDARFSSAGPTGSCSLLIRGTSYVADIVEAGADTLVTLGGTTYRIRIEEAGRRSRPGGDGAAHGSGQRLIAPMPGKVVAVHVRAGDRVEAGAPLVVLEAMKMENEFRALAGGVVTEVRVAPGEAVNAGDVLVVVA